MFEKSDKTIPAVIANSHAHAKSDSMETAKRAKRKKPSGQINRDWWDSLSINQQEKYVKEHPRTPYKKYLKQSKSKSKKSRPSSKTDYVSQTKDAESEDFGEYSPENFKIDVPSSGDADADGGEDVTQFDKTKDLKDLNYNEQIDKDIERKLKSKDLKKRATLIKKTDAEIEAEVEDKLSHVKKMTDAFKNFNDEQRAFFNKGQHKPGSDYRRGLSQAMRDKASGIKTALKHEVKEWKLGAEGMRTFLKGGKMDSHQKSALKNIALHSSLVVVPAAVSGGLAAGVAALPMLAFGFLEHTLLLAAGRSAIWASAELDENMRDPDSYSDDELLELIIEKLTDGIENAPLSNRDWVAAFMKSNVIDAKKKKELEDQMLATEDVRSEITSSVNTPSSGSSEYTKSNAESKAEKQGVIIFKSLPVGARFVVFSSKTPKEEVIYEKISQTRVQVVACNSTNSTNCINAILHFGLNTSIRPLD